MYLHNSETTMYSTSPLFTYAARVEVMYMRYLYLKTSKKLYTYMVYLSHRKC